jgi:hypothetical protein
MVQLAARPARRKRLGGSGRRLVATVSPPQHGPGVPSRFTQEGAESICCRGLRERARATKAPQRYASAEMGKSLCPAFWRPVVTFRQAGPARNDEARARRASEEKRGDGGSECGAVRCDWPGYLPQRPAPMTSSLALRSRSAPRGGVFLDPSGDGSAIALQDEPVFPRCRALGCRLHCLRRRVHRATRARCYTMCTKVATTAGQGSSTSSPSFAET